MELTPTQASYAEGQPVALELSAALGQSAQLVITRVQQVVATVDVAAGAKRIELGLFERGGYGVRLGEATSAFDVLETPFERPRYGFVARLAGGVDVEAVTSNFRRMHLNVAQLYDWAYRHSQLMPPTERYLDPLGQERQLSVVNEMCRALAAAGSIPLGYSAVYAIGSGETDAWPDSLLMRPDGEPYRLGENFLVLVDPSEPAWLEHYLEQLASVVAETELAGFHLDQYGWPKFARRPDGTAVDLAAAFVTLLERIRERLPDAPFMFNNVNDFPTYATASTPQDATYIEVWDPHSTLQDLGALATSARQHRPEHPPILSAYLSCYQEGEEAANAAAALVMATAWSHGASHLLLGEEANALTGPYYPENHVLAENSLNFFAGWYDFQVRYGDLLYDPAQVDVTEFFMGGINGDIVLSGAESSTKATAGAVWTRVVRTPHGLVVHLIDLTGQSETVWDHGKAPGAVRAGIELAIAPLRADASIWFATVDSPDMVELTVSGTVSADQTDALSAGQASVTFAVPPFETWAVLFIPADQLS